MPRHPQVAAAVSAVRGSVYSHLAHRLATHPGETYPLHVGDTWLEPPEGCRMEDLTVAAHPGMHRYTEPHGLKALRSAVAERVEERTGVPTAAGQVIVTAGATGGLGAVVGALVDPGDEVLLLAPYWPLIAGIVTSFHGVAVPVPWFAAGRGMTGAEEQPAPSTVDEALATLERHRTGRTVALYLNTPNNPSGRVIPPPWLDAVAAWAADHDLWLLADEVYEDYAYDGPHAWTRPRAPERTLSFHSFSKALGMAGNRCGYVVGPEAVMAEVLKVSTHTFYSAPTAGQLAGLAALDGRGERWIAAAKERYGELGRNAARRLGVPAPEGSTFLFLDLAEQLDERGLEGFLADAVDRGLFVAPGPSFGPYPSSIRVCYTSVEPARVERGIETLARLLGR